MNPTIEELTGAVEREARKRPEVLRLMTHPGVGPLTALAYVLIIGTPTRFERGKQIGTYVGLIPSEDSSAGKQRLGHISKQGSSLLRFLLVEAAQAAARIHPDWRRRYKPGDAPAHGGLTTRKCACCVNMRAFHIFPFIRIFLIRLGGGVFFGHSYLTGRNSLQEF